MATTDRQNRLLVAEDWRKIYTAFQQADFKSYDFETLRRTMIAYLRENYPDDFNDFVESSEYVALIDLIAYVAQSLSFRVDLNARENFLRDSGEKKLHIKISSIDQLQCQKKSNSHRTVKDRFCFDHTDRHGQSGQNLANVTVVWNDATNSNYREQIIKILNSANFSGQKFGKPRESSSIGGIETETYTINSSNTDLPIFKFSIDRSVVCKEILR
jgi:hypothetical protein